ncbi:PREDICTED: uncharacterized protein LOC105147244 [Acromyrmex echinatior]|uniref:uncharacterized protein LOC105147244 n=1 Tax=Acromyrmex echinatior TaxID=103372 RepID=UPI0005810CBE|nr:PREDICTED: uncharacterized protein LOC105147244 [Acromyrmex echinatior]
MTKERELNIPNGRGVSKLFVLLPFAEIKRFLVWQAKAKYRIGDSRYETAAINFRDSNRNRWLKDGTSYFRTVTPVCFREYRVTEMYASFVEDCEEIMFYDWPMHTPILCTFTKYWPTSFNIDNYVGEVQAKWTPWVKTDPVIASNGPMKTVLHVEDLVATFMTIAKTDSNLLNFICIARVIHLLYPGGVGQSGWFLFFYVLTKTTY